MAPTTPTAHTMPATRTTSTTQPAKEINIAQSILTKRREKGLTQDELAEHIGVSKASVSKWETGQSYPDIALLPQLAAYFDISIDELMSYAPQMTKADISALYQKLAADFSKQPFDEVMSVINATVKKYYSCYPLLLQMVILLINHYPLAGEGEACTAVLEKAALLCKRIKTESHDVYLSRQANSNEAVVRLMLNQPAEAIKLLHDITLHPFSQDEMILAGACEMTGDSEAAKRAIQITSYQYVLYLVASASMLLTLHKNDSERFEEILRRGLAVADAYALEKLHPNAMLQLTSAAAFCLTERGDYERALEFLGKSVETYKNISFPAMLHGDDYFDLLGDWFADFDLGGNAPRDEKLVKKSFMELLSHPTLTPLFEMPAYRTIIANAQ